MDLLEESTLFGRLALGNRFLTQQQLDDVIDTQGQLQVYRRLGDIAVAKGYMTPQQLKQLLDLQERVAAIKSRAGAGDGDGPRTPAAVSSDTKFILHTAGAPAAPQPAATPASGTLRPLSGPAGGAAGPGAAGARTITTSILRHDGPATAAPPIAGPQGAVSPSSSHAPAMKPIPTPAWAASPAAATGAPPRVPPHPAQAPALAHAHAPAPPPTPTAPLTVAPPPSAPPLARVPAPPSAHPPAAPPSPAPQESAPQVAVPAEAHHPLADGPTDTEGLQAILKMSRYLGATDLHLQVGCRPFVRHHGELVFLKANPLTPEETEKYCRTVLTPAQRNLFFRECDVDFCYATEGIGRYRTNLFRDHRGFGLIFRIIANKIPTLEELGLPPIVTKFTTYSQGLILITGPTGCGKSSTLAALVDLINRERKEHIITVEDPIEYVMTSKSCLINQREVPRDSSSFARALRAALREDPDIIMIGEMRDLETISLAITAAETGHLVISTLHTRNAISTVDRIIDVFPPVQQSQIRAMVSESLRGILTQYLIRTANGQRRVTSCELLFNTPAIGNLIRDNRSFQIRSQMQVGRKLGMRLMDDSLKELVQTGTISLEVARGLAESKADFAQAGETGHP
ncbi:MAG: type IV pilus twitching motility protein PilT [Planctomycetes bacterium]|nr:type IV pilus twitching motility protein PilT [Planctomycetota bacterium]